MGYVPCFPWEGSYCFLRNGAFCEETPGLSLWCCPVTWTLGDGRSPLRTNYPGFCLESSPKLVPGEWVSPQSPLLLLCQRSPFPLSKQQLHLSLAWAFPRHFLWACTYTVLNMSPFAVLWLSCRSFSGIIWIVYLSWKLLLQSFGAWTLGTNT